MLKQIHQFITENLKHLSTQLSTFENNVSDETKAIREGYLPQFEQVSFTNVSPVSMTLLVGQAAQCDTSIGNVTVTLAASAVKSPPAGWHAIIKRSASNAITLKPSGQNLTGARRINATTSRVYAAATVGVFLVYFDGSDWWA